MENEIKNKDGHSEERISRRKMLRNAGKNAALTSATMLLVLSPKEAAASSPEQASIDSVESW